MFEGQVSMSAIRLSCPHCKAIIGIERVDLGVTLRCGSCRQVFCLDKHLDSNSRKWLRQMAARDYLTLGDGLYQLEGATIVPSAEIE